MARSSGAPDANAKPSLTVIDHSTDQPFAAEGDAALGAPYVQIVDNTGAPITNFGASTTPGYAVISTSTNGVTNLVTAQAGKIIRVTNIVLIANGSVNVKFQSHVTPSDLTGAMPFIANTGIAPGYSPDGHFQTVRGEALDINLSQAVLVTGYLTYTLI